MKDSDSNNQIEAFKSAINKSQKIVGFTGAGISTESGIPDYRSKGGLPKGIIVNLHGTNLEVTCLDCGFTVPSEDVFDRLDLEQGVPLCPKCDGFFKPNTISFGQQLRGEDLDRANDLAISCDLMIVVGSTLVVQPASSIPSIAKEKGALLAIITLSETPLDSYADFVFHLKVEDFLNLFQS